MRNIGILLLTVMLAACARDTTVPAGVSGGEKLTEPPAALMERKPLVIPEKNARVFEDVADEAPQKAKVAKKVEKDVLKTEKKISTVSSSQSKHFPYQNVERAKVSMPQLYYVLASRTVNKMLKSTAIIYNSVKSPTMYVEIPQNENPAVDLPNLEYAATATKNIISGAHAYALTENRATADYILQTYISQTQNYDREKPILSYRLILKNRANEKIGTWVDSLSPISNDDQSWW